MTNTQQHSLKLIAEAAVACESATGCPAELSAAQCIFESAWLAKAPGNNCFGIKAHASVPGVQLIATHEWFTPQEASFFLAGDSRRTAVKSVPAQQNGPRQRYDVRDTFAAYDSLAGCFADHARIIQRGPYAAAWAGYQQSRDLDAYIAGVAAHYATDPNYRASITAQSHADSVRSALLAARGAAAASPAVVS